MVTRLISPRTDKEHGFLSGSGGRFFFGKFIGRDGRTHLGIERVGRGERPSTPPVVPAAAFRESSRPSTPRPGEQSRPTETAQVQKPSEAYLGLSNPRAPLDKRAYAESPLRRSLD